MDAQKRTRVVSVIILILSLGNYARLSDTEFIRPIHMLTLMTIGAALAILIQQLIKRFREKK